MSNQNLAEVQSAYAAFSRGDIPGVLGILDASVEWTEAEGFPYGGTYHGPAAVLEGVFMRIGADWASFEVVPREIIDGGDTIVALGQYRGGYKTTGKSFQAEFAHVWKFRNGKVIRFLQYVDTLLVDRATHA